MEESSAERMGGVSRRLGGVLKKARPTQIDFISEESFKKLDRDQGLDDPADAGQSRHSNSYRQ